MDRVNAYGRRTGGFIRIAGRKFLWMRSRGAADFAKSQGLISERGFFNPGRREGLKLAFLEAAEQVPPPINWYVQAVSSAMGVYMATYRGAAHANYFTWDASRSFPGYVCNRKPVPPWCELSRPTSEEVIRPQDIVHKPTGIAEAILRGDPTPGVSLREGDGSGK